jgi:hypothetical protein
MTEIDLGLGILDHQLIDSDDRRCGKVDDLELEGVGAGNPHVTAILVGAQVWRGRGLLGRLAARLVPGRTVRVPWAEVAEIASGIRLRHPARDLRLGRGDDRAGRWIGRLPGAR